MKPVELVAPLADLKIRISDSFDSDGQTVLDAVIDLMARFGDAEVSDLVVKLGKLKPAARRATGAPRKRASTKKEAGPPSENVEKYSSLLLAAKGNGSATSDIVRQLRPAGVVTPAELRLIAKALGITVTSKSTKAVLFNSIEGSATQAGRDEEVARKIREGA